MPICNLFKLMEVLLIFFKIFSVGGIFDVEDGWEQCQKTGMPYVLWIEVLFMQCSFKIIFTLLKNCFIFWRRLLPKSFLTQKLFSVFIVIRVMICTFDLLLRQWTLVPECRDETYFVLVPMHFPDKKEAEKQAMEKSTQ